MILAVVSNVCVTITRHRQMINNQVPAIYVCVCGRGGGGGSVEGSSFQPLFLFLNLDSMPPY